jgi:hypothetical protein
MLQNFSDLLPFRDYDEHDIVNFYSLDQTGVGGRFVSFLTGNNSPEQTAGNYSATPVGASYAGAYSMRYENPRKVTLSASGDTKGVVLGLSLYGTVEYDNNGQKLILNPDLKKELGVVCSGESIPVATNGYFRIKSTAYTNTPIPGYVAVIAGAGKVAFVAPSAAVFSSGLNVGKVLSTSGSAFGGYADIKLTLS